ncbi:hypothetical protein M409DRAFT_58265 [Zasmidium cellare ATCC 36951]|uniref:Uncharacterized protein n=1 Tax=Zasmidium cellare ATCC 36951 TaxID=1080233 RepID=A0A6A6C8E6_ZASCE|nr:uncharacterized protein M409DRAFT_58265 [Zasmidium cellare ATCC 36951]KAF2162510.1 hypothetical protein M409DRAFT_58265 [Zasmidium cellare ATCC 36951]
MVLEEATSPQEPSASTFPSDAPSSDDDPYAGDRSPTILSTRDPTYVPINQPGSEQIYVNLTNLPKPVFQSTHPPFMTSAIQDACKAASSVLQRPVRQEEADALAYHMTRGLRIGSYGGPIGTLCAMPIFLRGIPKFRFPGWTPGKKFNPDKFMFLSGGRARIMWHTMRFFAYSFAGTMAGQVALGSYALSAGSAGRLMDPRLKDLSQKIRENARNGPGGLLPGKREVDQTAGPREGETVEMARQRARVQEAWRRNRQGGAVVTGGAVDDMSPTGGAFAGDFVEEGSGSQSDTFVSSDVQAQRQISSAQRQDGGQSQSPSQRPSGNGSRREEASDPFASSSSEPESKPSGSAWERLRQQAASGQNRPSTSRAQPASRSTSNEGDSFTFSNADEDKQLARAEAQKQFDARIDREREGKDFEDSRGRRGW